LGVAENAETASEKQQQTRGDKEEIITAAASQGLLLLPPKIQHLLIASCFCNPPNDDHIEGGGLQRLSLRQLHISGCAEFFSSISPSSFPPFPTFLQSLSLDGGVKHMETLHTI
jgi:hypothetical protein